MRATLDLKLTRQTVSPCVRSVRRARPVRQTGIWTSVSFILTITLAELEIDLLSHWSRGADGDLLSRKSVVARQRRGASN